MQIDFVKYQATGNDFIVIDNRELFFEENAETISLLCNRRFGIGSDGLLLIQDTVEADFEMVFYNPDASKSLCGNGSRAAVAYANKLGMIGEKCQFVTTDGLHEGIVHKEGKLSVSMRPVKVLTPSGDDWIINTGSPHYIKYVEDVEVVDVQKEGARIRYAEEFKSAGGINVNFVQKCSHHLKVRTYERGVESETLSCGTGVTAVALSAAALNFCEHSCAIETKGGSLEVAFEKLEDGYGNIWLKGPAMEVFKGTVEI